MKTAVTLLSVLIAVSCVSAESFLAPYYENIADGSWRFEVSSTRLGQADQYIENKKDTMLVSNIDYQWPLENNAALSLRIVPMLFYHIDVDKLDAREDVNIYSFGAGLAWKTYQRPEHDGLYLELGAVPIWNSANFPGNSSNFNFLLNVGLGYEFDNGISAAVKYNHISNANLADRNRGVDTFSFAMGFRF